MNRDDVLKVDELKEELSTAFRAFERSLRGVFGQLVYALDEVIERYNRLEGKHTQLASDHQALKGDQQQLAKRLDLVTERLLVLERQHGRDHQ